MLRDEGRENDWLIGTLVGDRYFIERKLGEGGMGIVYLAEHRHMRRKSALKVLRPEALAIPDALGRFVREAENASRISHPNIAAVYDCADVGDELMYIAMEYVDGERLSDLLARVQHLSPARAAHILLQIASALRAAHELGIVHRDLKPDNIMLGRSADGRDMVKVVDFGIARAVMSESQRLTASGVVLGTPLYMSPEQLAGESADSRSDQYALALMVCEMLTGKLPYSGTGPEMQVRMTQPPKRLNELLPEVAWPEDLQHDLNRALAQDPDARFENVPRFARAVVSDLARRFPDDFRALSEDGAAEEGTDSRILGIDRLTASLATPPIALPAVRARRRWGRKPATLVVASVALVAWIGYTLAVRPSAGTRAEKPGRSDSSAFADTSRFTAKSVAVTPRRRDKPLPESRKDSVLPVSVLPNTVIDTPLTVVVAVRDSAAAAPPPVAPAPSPPTTGTVVLGPLGDAAPMLYINGELRGALRRISSITVPLGNVHVRLRIEGCQDWDTTVTVSAEAARLGKRSPKC